MLRKVGILATPLLHRLSIFWAANLARHTVHYSGTLPGSILNYYRPQPYLDYSNNKQPTFQVISLSVLCTVYPLNRRHSAHRLPHETNAYLSGHLLIYTSLKLTGTFPTLKKQSFLTSRNTLHESTTLAHHNPIQTC